MFNYSYAIALSISAYSYFTLEELLANPSNVEKKPPSYYHNTLYGILRMVDLKT